MVSLYIPDSGDLVWLDFDPQAGREQAGRRPALVLSPRSFNQRTSLAYVCPITSKIKGYSSEVLLPTGLPVNGAILCEHMRSLDWQARTPELIGKVPDDILLEVREIVGSIAGITP
ncbi:MAG: type II toxin-antitoxin system PemK/MazF family toxin [Terracidiphilus sp.]